MIAAIADDLTGATEIAGLGWRHGLSAEVLHRDESAMDADLVVYDSDSRHCTLAEAQRRVRRIVRRLKSWQPEWIFKKTDSVLRGNVLAEVEVLLDALRLHRCILSPANPTGGRVIRKGRYFIGGMPVDRTDFRQDPHHPRLSSRVTDLLGPSQSVSVACQASPMALPEEGIVVAEVTQFRDVKRWARAVDAHSLPAGGGDFFHALLQARGFKPRPALRNLRIPDNASILFVCGSLANSALKFLEQCRGRGWPVLLMPEELLRRSRCFDSHQAKWAREILEALRHHPKVAAGIGRPLLPGRQAPLRLGMKLINMVARVLKESPPGCLCVEGGATAVLLTQKLRWKRLAVEREYARGVTAVNPYGLPGLHLVFKPGSYAWPSALAA